MIAVIFEVIPREGHHQTYLDAAAQLRPRQASSLEVVEVTEAAAAGAAAIALTARRVR